MSGSQHRAPLPVYDDVEPPPVEHGGGVVDVGGDELGAVGKSELASQVRRGHGGGGREVEPGYGRADVLPWRRTQ